MLKHQSKCSDCGRVDWCCGGCETCAHCHPNPEKWEVDRTRARFFAMAHSDTTMADMTMELADVVASDDPNFAREVVTELVRLYIHGIDLSVEMAARDGNRNNDELINLISGLALFKE